jgi:hypothetical protein
MGANAIEEIDTGGAVVIAQAAVPLQRVQESVANTASVSA